jgi:hypothetical protein
MVLQNKSDSSNGHALKSSNFRLNLLFFRVLPPTLYSSIGQRAPRKEFVIEVNGPGRLAVRNL